MTDLVQFIIILIFVGFLFWLANRYIPMDRRIRQILNILAVIALVCGWVIYLGRSSPFTSDINDIPA